jgi:hypothetical protein
VPAGDGFSATQRAELERAVAAVEAAARLRVVLHVGVLDGGRAGAERLIAAQGPESARALVVAVDPVGRGLEIVTGVEASRVIDDRTCAFAALAMTSSFGAGDLVGGIVNGLQILAAHARHPVTRHLEQF